MKLARFLGPLFVLAFALGSAQAQQCLHASDESAPQKERKQLALGAVRFINTAQMYHFRQFGKFVTLKELASSGAIEEVRSWYNPEGAGMKAIKALDFLAELEILPGFEFRLTTNGEAYSLLLRDKTDPCLFTLYSDQVGVIYYGQPIDRPPSTSPLD
ncbi:MAG TPA: hypothetical protein VLB32_04595 [Candidatus Acidoferrales bacterium]|nr:hypothetical protein [Candidatus Acidoferrales bacterium]